MGGQTCASRTVMIPNAPGVEVFAHPGDGVLDILSQSRGEVTDGQTVLSCGEIAAAVAQTIAMLDGWNVAQQDCVAFSCDNDLPSATVLLALLASGRTFLLYPRAATPIDAINETFCRYELRIRERPQGADTPILADASISVLESSRWQAGSACEMGRFFVPTSGSTGRAKLVRHRHDRLLQAAGHCAARLGLTAADRIALPVPIAHMFGLGAAFIPAVLAGASIDLQPNANALRYLARERHFDPTVAFMTPSLADAITRLRKVRRPYRLTVMAGDLLPADLFDRYERLHGCVVNLYGSTELGVIAAGDPADPIAVRRDVIGRPMPGVIIRHEGREDRTADILCFRHEHGFECYVGADGRPLREPDGSVMSGAYFRGNDVGRLADGYVAVHGRADDLVNRDGLLVACADVAAALRTIPGIADAHVLGGAMTRRGRALRAFCVLAPGMGWEVAAFRKACLGVLAARCVPDEVVFVLALPRLASGKVDRVALQKASASF